MQAPLFIRRLTDEERTEIKADHWSSEGCTVRRSQMLRLSAEEKSTTKIVRIIGCSDQTVRKMSEFKHKLSNPIEGGMSRAATWYLAGENEQALWTKEAFPVF